ncbi:hypothetical protein NA56DRAFT_748485 [Hyaloscypha hepaticicola]|uniref:Uncharacterized protein n=1 Tax=Hyaloscypha hepaticicola TaxID=2082293 RepID=A0A2J6Q783_9HELO|nr:hypothetical protein NA56DRAFT_748485 [Hyaloscypha hepaticicola]
MGVFSKKSGPQVSHHSASVQDSAQTLHRQSAPENAQNSSSPHGIEQPHQISISNTPASSHHGSKDGFSSHTPSNSQQSKQPSHRIAMHNKSLPRLDTAKQSSPHIPRLQKYPDTHLHLPEEPGKYSKAMASWGSPLPPPPYQTSSNSVPPEAPVFPKANQNEKHILFRAPNFQHPHHSTTPDTPPTSLTPESPKYTSPPQYSGSPPHYSDTQPLINSTNSLSLGHRQQPSHQAHSNLPKENRCNTCHREHGTNSECPDCRGGLADFRNLTSQTNGQTATKRCAMCGKPAEKDSNRCLAHKDKSVADWLVHDKRKNLYRN